MPRIILIGVNLLLVRVFTLSCEFRRQLSNCEVIVLNFTASVDPTLERVCQGLLVVARFGASLRMYTISQLMPDSHLCSQLRTFRYVEEF